MRERRGLSSVIGAIFMIIVMAAALNVALWTMQQQDRVTEAVVEKANSNLDKLNEQIEISDIKVSDDRLNMTVTNTGGAAANLRSVYIINETAHEQYRYDVDLTVDGRDSVNIDTLPLIFKDDTDYSVKVVTESGNSAASTITPLSRVSLPMSLYIIPPTITPGENVTVLYTVTNNLTDSQLAEDLTLSLAYTLDCAPLGSDNCNVTKFVQPPSNTTSITKGNTALFKWVFEIDAPDETEFSFNATLANAKSGNYAREEGLVKLIDASKTSFESTIVVSSTLVQKPEIFAMFPSPFGEGNVRGVWGVAVANPTDQPMEVTKIIITAISPRGQSQDVMIDANACNIVSVSGGDNWDCPATNMLMWKKTNPGIFVEGHSAMTFMSKLEPGSLAGSGVDLESYSIDITVFTSMGQFSKSGYSGSMRNGAGAMANVYLSSAVNSTDTTKILGNFTNLKANTWKTFNATITDFETTSNHEINSGSRLIIDVPKCFDAVEVLANGGFTVSGPTEFSDGSWQIIGTLTGDLGGSAGAAAKTIQFRAHTASDIEDELVYIMYILADGETDGEDAFPVGPIAEVPIQVIP